MYCFGIAFEYNSKAYKVDITKESVNIVEFFKDEKMLARPTSHPLRSYKYAFHN